MSRNVRRSRHAVVAENPHKRGLADEPEQSAAVRVRRARGQQDVPNPLVAPLTYYGFLSRKDGPPEGPWHTVFECTEQFWFDATVAIRMPDNYKLDRLRQQLNGRSYQDAWESGIAARVVLRHLYDEYLNLVVDSSNPAPLALYEIQLYPDDVSMRFNLRDPSGQGNVPPQPGPALPAAPRQRELAQERELALRSGLALRPGFWYGLSVAKRPTGPPLLDTGILHIEQPATGQMEDPQNYALTSLENLPDLPEGGLMRRNKYLSQAELHALHHIRREE